MGFVVGEADGMEHLLYPLVVFKVNIEYGAGRGTERGTHLRSNDRDCGSIMNSISCRVA